MNHLGVDARSPRVKRHAENRESFLKSELRQRRAETLQLAAASFSFGLLLLMLVANLFEGTAALGNGGFIAAQQGFFDQG